MRVRLENILKQFVPAGEQVVFCFLLFFFSFLGWIFFFPFSFFKVQISSHIFLGGPEKSYLFIQEKKGCCNRHQSLVKLLNVRRAFLELNWGFSLKLSPETNPQLN